MTTTLLWALLPRVKNKGCQFLSLLQKVNFQLKVGDVYREIGNASCFNTRRRVANDNLLLVKNLSSLPCNWDSDARKELENWTLWSAKPPFLLFQSFSYLSASWRRETFRMSKVNYDKKNNSERKSLFVYSTANSVPDMTCEKVLCHISHHPVRLSMCWATENPNIDLGGPTWIVGLDNSKLKAATCENQQPSTKTNAKVRRRLRGGEETSSQEHITKWTQKRTETNGLPLTLWTLSRQGYDIPLRLITTSSWREIEHRFILALINAAETAFLKEMSSSCAK